MSDLRQFARNMRKRGQDIVLNSNRLKKRAAQVVANSVAQNMPIDTGRAVSNTIVSLGAPEDRILEEARYPGKQRATASVNQAAAIAHASDVISRALPEQEVWLSNNLDYVVDLNNGSSPQAPAGFLERAVLEGRAVIRTGKIL